MAESSDLFTSDRSSLYGSSKVLELLPINSLQKKIGTRVRISAGQETLYSLGSMQSWITNVIFLFFFSPVNRPANMLVVLVFKLYPILDAGYLVEQCSACA